MNACEICSGAADQRFTRREIWRDALWRLTLHSAASLGGFCYLEPHRHIPYITDLSGAEAETFGSVLAKVASALQTVTGCERVYVEIFGGTIPHLHVHLAPHRAGDGYCDAVVHGDIDETPMGEVAFEEFARAFTASLPASGNVNAPV